MTDTSPPPPAPAIVRRAFGRAAAGYDEAAVLQREVAAELLTRIEEQALSPQAILDLGAGTGTATAILKARFRRAAVIALDLAPPMLAVAGTRRRWLAPFALVCGDAHALPLAAARFDLVHSSLMLQWVHDLDRVLAEIRRVLMPGGALMFSTLGPDTLNELRAAYATLDDGVHVNRFLDLHDVGDALTRAGFRDPVLDVERRTLTYADVGGLLRDLKAIGATAVPRTRSGLGGRRRRALLAAAYEPFRREGRLPATYEVIYARAIRGEGSAPASGGEVSVPLAALRRRR